MEDIASAPGSVSQVRESAAMLLRYVQTDWHRIDYCWTCHQRWFYRWP